MKRNQELVTKWLAALRGGQYKQGKGYLHLVEKRDDGDPGEPKFCCLGVLCDLDNAGWYRKRDLFESDSDADGSSFATVFATSRNDECMLDYQRMKAVGLTPADAEELASMNDQGKDFEFIAEHIEKKLAFYDENPEQFDEQ